MGYSTSMNNTDNADGGNIATLTDQTFDDFVKSGYVFVDFWAEWCHPCLAMAPMFHDLSVQYKDTIKFAKLNVDDNVATSMKFNITSIPRFILFKDGEMEGEITGAMPKPIFTGLLDKYIS